jgi:hypothetical protein
MDLLITSAARALAAGNPLGALNLVALRDDAPALALRGIAMAQLGDFRRARALLRSAARNFDHKNVLARSRCVVAEAEIALVSRWKPMAIRPTPRMRGICRRGVNCCLASSIGPRMPWPCWTRPRWPRLPAPSTN